MNRTIRKKENALSGLVAFEILSIGASLFCLVLAVLLFIMPTLAFFGVAVPNESVVAMSYGSIALAAGSLAFCVIWFFLKRFHAKLFQELRNEYKESRNDSEA